MNNPLTENKPERLQKILAANGIASRRAAEKMILKGRVSVNGIQALPGQSAVFGHDRILVDGTPLSAITERVYLMLNKPCGYLTTVFDSRGRQTVMKLVKDVGVRVFPVGRLDLNSEGLLLFTNDGDFAYTIMHPSFEKEKTYEVVVRGDVQKAEQLMRKPVEINRHTVQARKVVISKVSENGGVLEITIVEGRNRQVRKMCAACGLVVDALKRVSIGTLELGELESGQWRHLTDDEIVSLR